MKQNIELLKQAVRDTNIKQTEIAHRLNVSRQTLSTWLNSRELDIENLKKICEVIQRNYKDFILDENIPTKEQNNDITTLLNIINSLIKQYGNKNLMIAKYYVMIANLLRKKNFDLSMKYYQEALNLYNENDIKIHEYLGTIYNEIGYLHFENSKFEESITYYDKAIEIYTKVYTNDHKNIIDEYFNIAVSYKHLGDYDKSIHYYEKCILQYEVEGSDILLDCYNNIAGCYFKKQKYEIALKYFFKAFQISETCIGYGNIGSCYLELGNKEQAYFFLNKAIEIATLEKSIDDIEFYSSKLDKLNSI